jgi:SAM-dependent methyltransferase
MYEKKRLTFSSKGSRNIDGIMQAQIAAFLPTNQVEHVLDYGAGNSPYRHIISCDRYITADISQNFAGDIDHIISPDGSLPLNTASINLVLLLDVLEHIVDPGIVVDEIRRLLAPRERLIISVPFIYREHETPNDFLRYTAFGMNEFIKRHGGKVVRISKAGNIYYTLLSLFLERGISNGEHSRLGFFWRLINRCLGMLTPVLAPILRKAPDGEDGIYHHLLLEVDFD